MVKSLIFVYFVLSRLWLEIFNYVVIEKDCAGICCKTQQNWSENRLNIVWVPGHSGVKGNEMRDAIHFYPLIHDEKGHIISLQQGT